MDSFLNILQSSSTTSSSYSYNSFFIRLQSTDFYKCMCGNIDIDSLSQKFIVIQLYRYMFDDGRHTCINVYGVDRWWCIKINKRDRNMVRKKLEEAKKVSRCLHKKAPSIITLKYFFIFLLLTCLFWKYCDFILYWEIVVFQQEN